MKNLKKLLRNSWPLLFWLASTQAWAVAAKGGNYDMTKCLVGETGINQVTSADYNSAYALGEDVAGTKSMGPDYEFLSGYFSGYASGSNGIFNLVSATVGSNKILQDGLQVGVPLNAPVQLFFSSSLDPSSIAAGIRVTMIMDHLGQPQNGIVPSSYTYDVSGSTVIIMPQGAWPGNALLDVVANSQLRSIDGFVLGQDAQAQFVTVMDPQQENVVLHPIPVPGVAGAASVAGAPSLNLDIPMHSLSDYAYVLVSQDPIHAPLQVDPQVLQSATQKAQVSGGAYETPLALQEIAAFSAQGQPMSLSKSIALTVSYTGGQNLLNVGGVPVRSQTLSLWVLDSAHQLWVKMPDSRPQGVGVSGAVTQFSVYALMGSADGNASSVFVFPTPWRPHGPGAGRGAGQSGTDSEGITFANLPSECTITVYTVSGSRVQTMHHSDLTGIPGEEKWDGNNSSGDHAASGVYLWRVESSADSKNGKLMIIR